MYPQTYTTYNTVNLIGANKVNKKTLKVLLAPKFSEFVLCRIVSLLIWDTVCTNKHIAFTLSDKNFRARKCLRFS